MTHRKNARPKVLLLILQYRLHNRSSSRNNFHVPRQVRAACRAIMALWGAAHLVDRGVASVHPEGRHGMGCKSDEAPKKRLILLQSLAGKL